MVSESESQVYTALDSQGIAYERHEHPPVFTVEEAKQYWAPFQGMHCKNLFVRNKKGDRHYLLVMEHSKKTDLKKLARTLGEETLTFASEERLMRFLGLTKGAVSPYGLLNDTQRQVIVVMDIALAGDGMIYFHPNVNTATLGVKFIDFQRFLSWTGNEVRKVLL